MNDFADTVIQFRGARRPTEDIYSLARAATLDVWLRSRRTEQQSRDSSLKGLACEVLGEERGRRWLKVCDPLEAPILSSYLLRRARSSQPVDFREAAAAVWA